MRTALLALALSLSPLALAAPASLPRRSSSSSSLALALDARDLELRRDSISIPGFDSPIPTGVELLYFPAFEAPKAGEVFQAGGVLRVAWNTTKPYDWTDEQLPKTATVRLGYLDASSPGYHLDVAEPLGEIEYYGAGTADLPLPAGLATRSTYFITAGSTSVTSAQFTIEAVAASSSSSSTTTTPAAVASSSARAAAARPAAASSSSASSSAAREVETPAAAASPQADEDSSSPSSSSSSAPAAALPASASSSSSTTTTPAAPSPTAEEATVPSSSSGASVIAAAAASQSSPTSGATALGVSGGLVAIVAGVVAVACAL
ncbi:hypothetical protein JCM6882_009230 [Rhodosporidiobolus microsporus]